ncbi:MAG TPA: hypothetical protein PKE07_08670 [Lacibacter sp.]|nr:hypothetical protein [Lacibacter sp.]HMO90077.1 hypothetical protein [Lacibacter sp.]
MHRILYMTGYGFRFLGILAFLATCYFWFGTAQFRWFLIAKQATIVCFSCSLLLWLVQVLFFRRR